MAVFSINFRSGFPLMGLLFWMMIVGAQGQHNYDILFPDWTIFHPCNDNWDVRYPFLVEVKYTGLPRVDGKTSPFYHRPRHGSLFTPASVLTRAHDLETYPATDKGEKVPANVDDCLKGGTENPCLFVNTRRPMGAAEASVQYCGQNIVVKGVIPHPKFGQTAKNLDELPNLMQNQKFPFAILTLQENVKTPDNMTVFPGLLFPSTPLDLFYLLRRVASIGYNSHFCEFPHFFTVNFDDYYPYENSNLVQFHVLNCARDEQPERDNRKKDQELCHKYALCNRDRTLAWYDGMEFYPGHPKNPTKYYYDCANQLHEPNVFKHSFFVFTDGNKPYRKPVDRKFRFDKMGTTIVCNGVALGLVSSWRDRGPHRQDAYVSTNFLRAWNWLMMQRFKNLDPHWHRALDDTPYLGANYKFKYKWFPTRRYGNSMFELSLKERTIKRLSSGSRNGGSLGSVLLVLLVTSH